MKRNDVYELQQFSTLMMALGEVFNRQVTPELTEIFLRALEKFEIDDIAFAVNEHISSGRFFPVPSDLKRYMPSEKNNYHLTANEAWAIAVKMQDESETVVYTEEIMTAYTASKPILDLGDEVGARMAFVAAYDRLDKFAAPKWKVSLGSDKALRHVRVEEAVTMGRLPQESLLKFPKAENGDLSALTNQVEERLALAAPESEERFDLEKARKNLAALRGKLNI